MLHPRHRSQDRRRHPRGLEIDPTIGAGDLTEQQVSRRQPHDQEYLVGGLRRQVSQNIQRLKKSARAAATVTVAACPVAGSALRPTPAPGIRPSPAKGVAAKVHPGRAHRSRRSSTNLRSATDGEDQKAVATWNAASPCEGDLQQHDRHHHRHQRRGPRPDLGSAHRIRRHQAPFVATAPARRSRARSARGHDGGQVHQALALVRPNQRARRLASRSRDEDHTPVPTTDAAP